MTPLSRAAHVALVLSLAAPAAAQGFGTATVKPRPWSRVSFFTNSAVYRQDAGPTVTLSEFSTAFAYQLPELDEDGMEYGIDARFSAYAPGSRPERVSLYEGFVGRRLGNGAVRLRAGHIWLSDLGTLGSLAGGLVEIRQRRPSLDAPRWRLGAFGGLEPNVLDVGYASGVKKAGGYAAYDGTGARRHSIGYAMVRNGGLTERSVVTTSNFVPLPRNVFVYQMAEFNVQQPAGVARKGLSYFFANGRASAGPRVELQASFNRGRSIDARGLGEDLLSGRPVTQSSVDGLLYQSIGGRATVEVIKGVRMYAGYSRDKNNRDTDPMGRTLVGGYASNVGGSGLDISASDSYMQRPLGSYHSRYVSVGHLLGRNTYVSGDYSTSLSVIRFSRSDGITIETRPHTTRVSGTATVNLRRAYSVLFTAERTGEDQGSELRILTGITYRMR